MRRGLLDRRVRGDPRRGRDGNADIDRQRPLASTVTLSPGGMTVVASRSSMIAGPAMCAPGARA